MHHRRTMIRYVIEVEFMPSLTLFQVLGTFQIWKTLNFFVTYRFSMVKMTLFKWHCMPYAGCTMRAKWGAHPLGLIKAQFDWICMIYMSITSSWGPPALEHVSSLGLKRPSMHSHWCTIWSYMKGVQGQVNWIYLQKSTHLSHLRCNDWNEWKGPGLILNSSIHCVHLSFFCLCQATRGNACTYL